jgi:tetratricopeptide (TPR) repeat protein
LLHLYQVVRLMMARRLASQGNPSAAIEQVRAAQKPPASLGVDDFAAWQSARLFVFEACLRQAMSNFDATGQAWKSAAGTGHEAISEEGLFRAIALYRMGEKERAEGWLKNFLEANERQSKSERAPLRAQAHYLAGIYAAFRGKHDEARESFRRCLEIDRAHLWAGQAWAWLEAGLLTCLAR